jgi:hypothetical protein
VTIPIGDRSRAIAVELVLHRPLERGARGHRARDDGIDIRHVHVQVHGAAAHRERAAKIHVGKLIREHHARVADLQLRVTDATVRLRQPHGLRGAERVLVEVNGRRRALDAQVRDDHVVSIWDGRDPRHDVASWS